MNQNTELKPLAGIALLPNYTTATLVELFSVLFPYFVGVSVDPKVYNREYWIARDIFKKTLWDHDADRRQSFQHRWEENQKRISPAEFLARYMDTAAISETIQADQVLPILFKEFRCQSGITFALTAQELREALNPFLDEFAKHISIDELHEQEILWNVCVYGYPLVQEVFWQWLSELENEKRLPFTLEAYRLAISLYLEDANHVPLEEKRYVECLVHIDSPCKVLAALAAQRLGAAYIWENEIPTWATPLPEMLEWIYQKQTQGLVIAGAFLHNLIDGDGVTILSERSDLKAAHFDVRAWVLKVAIGSKEPEPYIYPTQAFWFYVHEYFDYDADAVDHLIEAKRYWLAMMCITESIDYGSLDVMRPALRKLLTVAPLEFVEEVKASLICHKINITDVMRS